MKTNCIDETNSLINSYEEKLYNIELSARDIEHIISCIKLGRKSLKNNKQTELNNEKILELEHLLERMETI